jgi:TonB-linked SusC/RagA family outer membrane protein
MRRACKRERRTNGGSQQAHPLSSAMAEGGLMRSILRQTGTLLAFLVLAASAAHGQEATITGHVTSDAGTPLASASVLIDGMGVGTVTRDDGSYSIVVPAARVQGQTVTLVARLIGYRPVSVPITLSSGHITHDFVLPAAPLKLGEVVVTGQGTTSTREKLGAVINTVDSSQIRRSNETNVVEALAGKAPNVYVNQQSGDPGASAYIRVRGLKTIDGDGQPLFIVDGVPIDNSTIETNTANPSILNNAAVGGSAAPNRASDINPNDIESVTILKGAAAAAIYGARAGEGVVLITTKHAVAGQTRYSLRSVSTFDKVSGKTYPLNTVYGQGSNDSTPACYALAAPIPDCASSSASWGPRLPAGTTLYNHYDELFKTGHTFDNTLSASGGNERTLFYASAGRSAQNGVVVGPNDWYDKTSARVNASHRVLDKLKVGMDITYVDTRGAFVQKGSNIDGLMLGSLRTPPEFNNTEFLDPTSHMHRSYRFPWPTLASTLVSRGYDNPFFSINNNPSNGQVSRALGNINAVWDPLEWLNVKETFGLDYYTDERLEALALTSSTEPDGNVNQADYKNTQLDQNLIATASHTFSPSFAGTFTIGQNLNSRSFRQLYVSGITLVAPQPLNINNTITFTPNDNRTLVHGESYFGQATADLWNQLYLTAGLRNDGYSSFGIKSQRHWFPKASAAWVFHQTPSSGTGLFTFGKLRVAYGETGTEPTPYSTGQWYQVGTSFLDAGWGPTLLENQNGQGGLSIGLQKAQPNLAPERTKEFETGIDYGLFDQKVDGGVTFYNDRSVGVIFQAPLPNSTGFFTQAQNAATLRNRGIEATLNYRPVTNQNVKWDMGVQFGWNQNRVISLAGQQFVDLATIGGFVGAVATVWNDSSDHNMKNHQAGVIRGNDFARCGRGVTLPDGSNLDQGACKGAAADALYIGSDGFPILDPQQRVIAVGNPDWTGSFHMSVTYHKVSLSALVDHRQGGQIWNGTKGALYNFGAHKDTDIRGQSFVFGKTWLPGATVGPGAGTSVVLDQTWFEGLGSGFGPVGTQFVESGTYTKLRELAVSYSFNDPWVRSLGLSTLDVRLAGRNLITWSKYTGVDPETNLAGAQAAIQGVDYFNNPQSRSFVIDLSLNR